MNELILLESIRSAITSPWLDPLMVALSFIGNIGAVWIAIGIICLFIKKYRKMGIVIIVAVALSGLLSKIIIGSIVMRSRPCDISPEVALLIPRPFGSSFPSGHATSAFAAFVVMIYLRAPKWLCISSGILAVLICISRVYLFVHYPTDVLAGIILGALIGIGVGWISNSISKSYTSSRSKSS